MGGKGLHGLFDTRFLCGQFGQVCNQVVGPNQTAREMKNQAWQVDNTVNRADRTADAITRGDVNGAINNGGAVLNNLGKLFN